MLSKLKTVLTPFILFALLLSSAFIPLAVQNDNLAPTSERKTGIMVIINYIEGNICSQEESNETFIRSGLHIIPGLGTSFFNISTVCSTVLLLVVYFLYSGLLQFSFNPVMIAEFMHLGDGMK
ncbi:MAG: hypothetical protein Q8876_10410 [Bacillota bacterium]|nr:hypothetical protein [Bacillota bacterium]